MIPKNNCQSTVELRAGKIPWISLIAVHYWFVIHHNGKTERWEVWQKPNQKPPCWGHLHQDLLPFDSGVGCGDSWVEQRFEGEQADSIIAVLQSSPDTYPNKHNYHYWPGPNSNTFVQWVLDQAESTHHLHPVGIGKSHLGLVGWQNIKGVSVFSTPLFGLRYQAKRYIEIHLLHLGLGLEFKPFKLRFFLQF